MSITFFCMLKIRQQAVLAASAMKVFHEQLSTYNNLPTLINNKRSSGSSVPRVLVHASGMFQQLFSGTQLSFGQLLLSSVLQLVLLAPS
jgi:hypothetical protein